MQRACAVGTHGYECVFRRIERGPQEEKILVVGEPFAAPPVPRWCQALARFPDLGSYPYSRPLWQLPWQALGHLSKPWSHLCVSLGCPHPGHHPRPDKREPGLATARPIPNQSFVSTRPHDDTCLNPSLYSLIQPRMRHKSHILRLTGHTSCFAPVFRLAALAVASLGFRGCFSCPIKNTHPREIVHTCCVN